MDGHEELNGVKAEPVVVTRNGNDEDWDFDKWDITNAYGEPDKFFKKVDNSEKAKQKRVQGELKWSLGKGSRL